MFVNGTVFSQHREVLSRRVAFVSVKPILRINHMKNHHLVVSVDFGQNGCRADGRHLGVPLHDGATWDASQVRGPVAVDQYAVGLDSEVIDSPLHGE